MIHIATVRMMPSTVSRLCQTYMNSECSFDWITRSLWTELTDLNQAEFGSVWQSRLSPLQKTQPLTQPTSQSKIDERVFYVLRHFNNHYINEKIVCIASYYEVLTNRLQ